MYKREKTGVILRQVIILFVVIGAGLLGSISIRENISYAAETNHGLYVNAQKDIADTGSEGDGTVTGSAITGWVQDNEVWHYYDNGTITEKPEGWYQINEKYYYLMKDGTRVEKEKDWYRIAGKYYYLKKDGTHVKKSEGFYYIKNKWCYLNAKGNKVKKPTGWYKISKKWYYMKETGKYYSGWQEISGRKYYFGSKGMLKNGWIKVNKSQYYQTKAKGIYKTAVIKDSSDGEYYFVNENGKRIDNKLTKYLVKVYRACTTESMTKEKKLYAMYMYLATPKGRNKHFQYERRYDDYKYVGKSGWTADYAYQMLSSGKGNCYRFACCFGYFAKMLGYDSYVNAGQCRSRRGNYVPHCWTEIRMNGRTYVYDSELQFAGSASNLYKKTYSTFPITIKKGKTYKIKF